MSSCSRVQLLPGPRGNTGTAGTNGTDGVSAFTVLDADFTMPAELATAVATVDDTSWMTTGNTYYLQTAGWLQVTAITSATSVTLRNLEDTATGAYPANVPPTTVIATGSKIVAAGIQGPAGDDGAGGAPVGATYLTSTPNGDLTNERPLSGEATGLVHSTIITGAITTVPTGVANGSVALVDDAGGLTSGEAMFATAAGVETKTAALARTALGLGTMATQADSAVAISGGTLTGVNVTGTGTLSALGVSGSTTLTGALGLGGQVYAPSSTLQSLLAATAINPNAFRLRVVGNGGAVTLTATPTISPTTTDGQLLIIQGTSDANTVTLQDVATLPGSQLNLGAGTRVLGAGDSIFLAWDLPTTSWYEISFSNV
jgi:hypothetical protein